MIPVLDGTVLRPPYSGVHTAVRNQLLALTEHPELDHSILLCHDRDVLAAATDRGLAIPEIPPATNTVARRILWQQLQLPGLLRHLDADVLFAPAYTAPRRCPVPIVLQVHDTIALRRSDLCRTLNALHMKWLMPGSVRRASRIMVPNPEVADEVKKILDVPTDRIRCVPLGVDSAFFAIGAELPAQWAALKPYVLFVGNLEPKKGLETLIDAYRELAAAAPETRLVLAGRPAWKCADLVRLIDSYDGPGGIRSLGYVDQQLLPALYHNAEAVVMPSVEEGFGLPVLEAMACGVPLVHSDHPVLMRTASGYGVPFPVGDAAALAGVLRELCLDPTQRQDLTGPARAYAEGCTWRCWADAAVEIFTEITG